MTLSTTTQRNDYTSTGQTSFAFTWRILAKSDIQVLVDGVTKTLNTDYTILDADVDQAAGGNVTFVTGKIPASGAVINLIRGIPQTQETDLAEGAKMPAESLEKTLDKIVMQVQDLYERTERAPVLHPSSLLGPLLMPAPVAQGHIRWKQDLSGLEAVTVSTSPITNQFDVDILANADLVGDGATQITGIADFVGKWPVVDVRAYGADPTGVADSAAAFRSAMTALASTGGLVYAPPGVYFMDSYDTTAISTDEFVCFALPSNVALVGASFESTSLKLSSDLEGDVIAAEGSGARISFIGTRTGTSGQIVRDLKFDYNNVVLVAKAFQSYNAVRADGQRMLLERLYIKNAPGRNMIVSEGQITIRECTIINGAQNVSGNTVSDDCSFLYLKGADNLVEHCDFKNESTAVINCGGIELHCTNSAVRHTKFTNLYPASYVGFQDANICYNIHYYGNQFVGNTGGIYMIDDVVGLVILGNYFDGNKGSGNDSIMCDRNDDTGATAGYKEIHIVGNTFDGDDQVTLAGARNSIIRGNRWKGCTLSLLFKASTTESRNIIIEGNEFIDPPSYGSTIGQIQWDGGTASWSATFQDFIIRNNLFLADRGGAAPTNQYALVAAGNASYTTMNAFRVSGNEVVNLQGEAAGSMAAYVKEWLSWTPSFSGATLSGYDQAKYRLAGKVVQARFQAESKNVTASGVITISSPVTLATGLNQLRAVVINDGASWVTTAFTVGSGGIQVYKTAALGSWAGTETGVTIRLDFSYPID